MTQVYSMRNKDQPDTAELLSPLHFLVDAVIAPVPDGEQLRACQAIGAIMILVHETAVM